MGTTWSVRFHSEDSYPDLRTEIQSRLDELDGIFSTYKPASEISKINQADLKVPIRLSLEMEKVLRSALSLAKESEGEFDPTVGGSMVANQFTPEISGKADRTGDWTDLLLIGSRLIKHKRVLLDLSAVAKGFAVDEITGLLKEKGISSALTEIGGDMRAIGKNGAKGWLVGVEIYDQGELVIKKLALMNESIAVSGLFRNTKEGASHIVDRESGRMFSIQKLTAYHLAPTCMEADGRATLKLIRAASATDLSGMGRTSQ